MTQGPANGPNRIFDEFAKLMTDAAGAAQGVQREVETAVQSQFERFLNNVDVVKREDFDALRDLVMAMSEENEALAKRVADLESQLKDKS